MRQAIEIVLRKPNHLKIVPRLVVALGPGADAMKSERFGNRNAHGHARIERGYSVLKDELHLASQRSQGRLRAAQDVDASSASHS